MWNEEKFQEFVAAMESDNPISKAVYCNGLFGSPSGDPRVLPYLEAALDDKTICLVMIPPTYADVAYEAALALAAERNTQNIDKPVILRQTIGRLWAEGLNTPISRILADNAEFLKTHYQNTGTKSGDPVPARLSFLRQAGKLELYDFEVSYSRKGECSFKRL
jgi:hypothetical protein